MLMDFIDFIDFHSVCRCDVSRHFAGAEEGRRKCHSSSSTFAPGQTLCACEPATQSHDVHCIGPAEGALWALGTTAWRNVKSCEEMWRDVKGMLTGWEWPCMTWEGDLEPGFEVRKGTPSLWGWVGWLTILRCVIFVFATLIKTESNHIKSNMFYSEVANLTQFLYTALSGCQGGPGRSLKILSLRVASCRFLSPSRRTVVTEE